jgi:hypothetical protein
MEWSVVEIREGFIPRVYYRVMCYIHGHSAVLDYKFLDIDRAERLARYMNASQEERALIDYAESFMGWRP